MIAHMAQTVAQGVADTIERSVESGAVDQALTQIEEEIPN